MNEVAHTVHDSNAAFAAGGMTEHVECQKRDHQTADDKADTVDGIRNRNCLQAAIAEKDRESRLRAFLSCVAVMEHDLDAPEWTTLLALFKYVRNLPLSTLEVWQALLHFPRIMAMIALHPGISFQVLTSRVDTELPFLWNFVSRQECSQPVRQTLF